MYVFLIDKKENIKITKLYLDIADQEIYPQWISSSAVFLYNKYILTMELKMYLLPFSCYKKYKVKLLI
jgi:hypothetical protein